jgi:hypothetical protein
MPTIASESAASTLPSTPHLSGAATPVPHYMPSSLSPTLTLAEAATPPMPSALPSLLDKGILASLDNTNFTHLTEQQQLELMNAAVTQFAGLCAETLASLNSLSTTGHASPGADSALAVQTLDSISQGLDDASLFSDEHSSPGAISLLDDNFLIEDFLL